MATVTAEMVKQLREETGASVLGCKEALVQFDGDMEKAKAYLAEKGLATAQKKADREAKEGIIATYTHHGGRVGVMVELNCETDFVANTDRFQELARDLTLHIAFANPAYLEESDIPADVVEGYKKEFADEARAQGKPDNVIERIVEGKLNKLFTELCLLQQPFVKDDELTVQDLIIQSIAELKENIRVSRFVRYELGSPDGADEA